MHIGHGGTKEKNSKLGQGGKEGSHGLLLKFWDPLHISGMGEARNFKFCTPMTINRSNQDGPKIGTILTALHKMQTQSSDENSVCQSVCPLHA